MSTIPFVLRRFQTATAPAAARRRSLALDVFRYLLLTVLGPAAAVLGVAALVAE